MCDSALIAHSAGFSAKRLRPKRPGPASRRPAQAPNSSAFRSRVCPRLFNVIRRVSRPAPLSCRPSRRGLRKAQITGWRESGCDEVVFVSVVSRQNARGGVGMNAFRPQRPPITIPATDGPHRARHKDAPKAHGTRSSVLPALARAAIRLRRTPVNAAIAPITATADGASSIELLLRDKSRP